jgi:hypothetical protein
MNRRNGGFQVRQSTCKQILAAVARLGEGKLFFRGAGTVNRKFSSVSRTKSKVDNLQERKTKFRLKVNVSKEEFMEVIPPLTQMVQLPN